MDRLGTSIVPETVNNKPKPMAKTGSTEFFIPMSLASSTSSFSVQWRSS
jgi:hypothetical protein